MDPNGNTTVVVNPNLVGVNFDEQPVVFRVNEGLLEFCAAEIAVSNEEELLQHRESSRRRGPILDLKLDFARWAGRSADSAETRFLQKLEATFDRWKFTQITSRGLEEGGESIAEEPFPSFVNQLRADQNFEIAVQVQTADCRLVADCEIGTDLHKFYVARSFIVVARALPLVRPDLERPK